MAAETQDLSVTLAITPEIRSVINTCTALQIAQSWHIDDADSADAVSAERTSVKTALAEVKAWHTRFVAPAKQIMEAASDLFKPRINDLTAADEHYKGLLEDWSARERQRVAEENARREAEARKMRQEAEAKAAAERARAEEQAREARRKVQEAEAAQAKALGEGNAKAAAKAAAEAAKQTEAERAARENGEARAQQAQLEAAAAAPVLTEVRQVAGTTMRDNWIAELAPGLTEQDAKMQLIAACVTRPDLVGLLDVKQGSIDKLAKALKSSFSVPGYVAANRPIAAKARAA